MNEMNNTNATYTQVTAPAANVVYTIPLQQSKGASPLSIAAFILSFFLCIISLILACVDLGGNNPQYSHSLSKAAIVIDCIGIVLSILVFGFVGSLL